MSAGGFESEDRKAREALAELFRIYWQPVFSFVCQRGYSSEDAKDLTQDFFVMILESDWLQRADQGRGRFRSFLLKSLQYFLSHAADEKRALKRGGGVEFVSWDTWMAEAPSRLAISGRALDALAPEELFDLRWAATVVDRARQRLREECESSGRLQVFETLNQHLAAERNEVSYQRLAAASGVAETVIGKQLHNLRQRYRWLLRDEVASTVENPADVNDELRYLCATLAAGG